jgi:cystathionine beta-synthase
MAAYTEPPKCQYHVAGAVNPHTRSARPSRNKILDSVLEHIGETPMVRVSRLSAREGLQCDLLVKCEFFNAGGSVKDRIGRRM